MGCFCFAKATDKPDKFSLRAIEVVHVGYSTSQKDYRLYNLKDKKFFVSRDVIFRQDIFPFQLIKRGRYPHLLFDSVKSSATYPSPNHQHNLRDNVNDNDQVQIGLEQLQ